MIPAKRFAFLDKETNVSVSDFTSKLDAGILNSAENELKGQIESLDSIIQSSVQQGLEQIKKDETIAAVRDGLSTVDPLKEVTRSVKGLASKFTDLLGLPESKLNDYLSSISDKNPVGTKALNSLLKNCRSRGMGYGQPGRPYSPSIDCGQGGVSLGNSRNGNSNCNAASYGDLLSKLTGGNFSSIFSDFNKDLQKIMALAGAGYGMNMCGVFGALAKDLPKDVLSKASGGLLSLVGQSGNTNAVLDIAKSSTGLFPLIYNPSAVKDFLVNYKVPENVKLSSLTNLAERTLGGLELLKESWNVSDSDGGISIAEAEGGQADLKKVFSAASSDRAFGIANINAAPSADMDFMLTSFRF